MLSQLIQRQVLLGNKVVFVLKNGREVSGVLTEIGQNHVVVESEESKTTILVDMIGSWEVSGERTPQEELVGTKTLSGQSMSGHVAEDHQLKSISAPMFHEEETLKKLFEIEGRFHARLQTAKIEVSPPDFSYPQEEFGNKQKAEAQSIWNRIKDRYEYAVKINELSAKFGRIQPIISELKALANWFPNSSSVKRHLAYLLCLSGNLREAIQYYKYAAQCSDNPWDWYNLAALTLKNGQEEIACYALQQFFNHVSIIESVDAWYIFVNLVKKFTDYRALHALCTALEADFSKEEGRILLETGVYLLKVNGYEQEALELLRKWQENYPAKSLVVEAFAHFKEEPTEAYKQLAASLAKETSEQLLPAQGLHYRPQGFIYSYNPLRKFGFIEGIDGQKYFFDRSAIAKDEELLDMVTDLKAGDRIPVVFETAPGPKGPVAIEISLCRTIEETFKLATEYAGEGEYHKAIAQIKKVLALKPEYPAAQELYDKWREYARLSGVPKGSNPYARAKRAQLIEKDLVKAEQLLRTAIERGDSVESAVKDLANLMAQQGKHQEAINILLEHKWSIRDQRSVNNILIGFYQKAGQYERAIELLEEKLGKASTVQQKAQVLYQIANNYLRKEDYKRAESYFRKVHDLQRENKAALKNIAVCLSKQGCYDEAEKILNSILDEAADEQAATLLEAIRQARITGQSAQVDEIIIEIELSDYPQEISKFTQFFLDRCDFAGVPPERLQDQNFRRTDVQKLEELATRSGARDRARYYLSAAKIVSQLEEEDPNLFYRYLSRSFVFKGDTAILEGKPLDVARAFYCEALSIYDGDRGRRKNEQEAFNALVTFLFSTLGQAQMPVGRDIPSIEHTLEEVLTRHPDKEKVFDAIAYLVFRSRYAANRILKGLYAKSSWQAMALKYLENRGFPVTSSLDRARDFFSLWNNLRRKIFEETRVTSNETRFLVKVELTTASIENAIERVRILTDRLFFDLDQQRARHLQKIFEKLLSLCEQEAFEEQERLCILIENMCRDLLEDIEENPTKFSIEELYEVIQMVQKKIKAKLEELYHRSMPQVSLRLAKESYTVDNNQQIEVQVVVVNQMGCSPAEAVELIIQEKEDKFTLTVPEIKLGSSLRGGDKRILRIPLRVSEDALNARTFSLPICARYRTRSGDTVQTSTNSFSIRLYSDKEFKEIENPYAAYAEGGVVSDPKMFYGRDELIRKIAMAIESSHNQSKCILVFGQKRAGKSSILYHLKVRLQKNQKLLVLDLGSIGSILDDHSPYPFLYQFLWTILRKLEYAIRDKTSEGFSPLNLSLPNNENFYTHPSPLVLFKELFEQFRCEASKLKDWRDVRAVLLIDEFSYIYSYIMDGRIPESFMKIWKALLQENYFSTVLVGQDVMPKFKQQFPNEFGTAQDERVSYLVREDAVRLIDEPIRISGPRGESRYLERAIDRILDLTAGSPFYIQIICNRLVEYMNRKREPYVTESDVDMVKDELIRGVNALGKDKFDNLINSGDVSKDAISDDDALRVLTAIAVNSRTGPCNRSNIVCATQTPVDVILDDLEKREVIERRGQYYSIRVGLFKEWLIAHYGGEN